jgi:hypothetical protein
LARSDVRSIPSYGLKASAIIDACIAAGAIQESIHKNSKRSVGRPRSSLTIVAEIGDLNTIDGLPETLAKAIINAIGV